MADIDRSFTLEDVFRQERGRGYMSGIQALVRLPLMQRRLDRHRGLKTAGLISGYRGSPLAAYDQQLWRAERELAAEDVRFQPALNEDLAATALWGAQMHRAFGPTRTDGVFGLWYGKGPGVDRTGDVFRTANMMGTSPLGGVLAIAGDDHAAQSSTFPHQTDGVFQAVSMPVLQPSNVQEILSLGLAGFALSRFSGLWVAMKTIADVVETAGAFDLPNPHPAFAAPAGATPAHGLNWDPQLAWPSARAELERRLIEERLPAALAWARANRLDHAVIDVPHARIGIVTVGKAHQDLMQALHDLGLDGQRLSRLGVGVYKVAMSWPLEPLGLRAFAQGLSELIVVEEKRGLVEAQIRSALYDLPAGARPRVVGKTDGAGRTLLAETGELDASQVAEAIAGRLVAHGVDEGLVARMQALTAAAGGSHASHALAVRAPFFCAGCPHNVSTQIPEGAIAGGGIGCHVMAVSMPERRTPVFSQMGGEGAQWIGAAPFSRSGHVFQNLGDGTYQHSGVLAVRAAIAAGVNITFKILYNDAVAMTGGQPPEGLIDPARITRQLAAEGVQRIALVSDDPQRWARDKGLADGVLVRHRDDLGAVQASLRQIPGVTAIVYEQTCAAEKRRRRKAAGPTAPGRRLFINTRVCEGCGDCSVQSNCIAVEPLETAYGRKRRINQTSCNQDVACANGFCPSFVEAADPVLRTPNGDRLTAFEAEHFAALPEPDTPALDGAYNILIAGVGGLGVLTIGAVLGVAAHLDGKAASVLDFTGMAQKNGAVVSQVRIAARSGVVHAARIGPGQTDLLLAADLVAASAPTTVGRLSVARSAAVLNLDVAPTAEVVRHRDAKTPNAALTARLRSHLRADGAMALRAAGLAQGLFGDATTANVLMLGHAWQSGLVPLSAAAIERAIALNGTAVALNHRAFAWGRLAAIDLGAVERQAGLEAAASDEPEPLGALIARRAADLAAYQDDAYADRFREISRLAAEAGARAGDADRAFVRAVAVNAYRLMAYKDEYEIARLYADPAFKADLAKAFSATGKLSVWLSPPLFARTDPATGRPRKRRFGPWVFVLFEVLARLKRLRGGPFDPFGYRAERRVERQLAADYLGQIRGLCAALSPQRLAASIALAAAPSEIRGFGPVKAAAIQAYSAGQAARLNALAADRLDQAARGAKTAFRSAGGEAAVNV
jgi:indolepyruvate ferredoxin oxidoreductase